MMAAAQQREQEAEQERQAKEMDDLRRQAEGHSVQLRGACFVWYTIWFVL